MICALSAAIWALATSRAASAPSNSSRLVAFACNRALLSFVLALRERSLGLPLGALRLQARQRRPVGLDPRPVDAGVDLGQEVAVLHLVADLDVDLPELARDLGADVDVLQRLQRAERGDRILDRAAGDRSRGEAGVGAGLLAQIAPGRKQPDQQHRRDADQQTSHRYPLPSVELRAATGAVASPGRQHAVQEQPRDGADQPRHRQLRQLHQAGADHAVQQHGHRLRIDLRPIVAARDAALEVGAQQRQHPDPQLAQRVAPAARQLGSTTREQAERREVLGLDLDQHLDHAPQLVRRIRGRSGRRREPGIEQVDRLREARGDQLLLGGEVAVEGGAPDASPADHVLDLHRLGGCLPQQHGRGLQDLLPARRAPRPLIILRRHINGTHEFHLCRIAALCQRAPLVRWR